MATAIHQQLKSQYVKDESCHEVSVDGYRIDAVDEDGRLIEIQCASLAAIRDKVRKLIRSHQVIVVKPLAARKRIVTMSEPDGEVLSSRYSPTRQKLNHIFKELVHFAVFPSPGLQLDIVLTEQEEIRLPPTERSSWKKKYSVHDRRLVEVHSRVSLNTAADLWDLMGAPELPAEFSTAHLAEACEMPRWLAQKAAWCFRRMEFLELSGKQGNSLLYQLAKPRRKRKRAG